MKRSYVGIDLAATPKKYTFLSHIEASFKDLVLKINIFRLREDDELIEKSINISPRIIVIDAPLSLDNVDDKGFRPLDRCALKLGARLLPLKTSGMKLLAMRGAMLARQLAGRGFLVLETHPFSVARLLGYKSTVELTRGLVGKDLSKGEADSVVAGLMGFLFDQGSSLICEGDYLFVLPSKGEFLNVLR